MEFTWGDGAELTTRRDGDSTIIGGNAAGLRSLANHLLVLAGDNAAVGSHLHLDDLNGLGPGSVEIILERTEA